MKYSFTSLFLIVKQYFQYRQKLLETIEEILNIDKKHLDYVYFDLENYNDGQYEHYHSIAAKKYATEIKPSIDRYVQYYDSVVKYEIFVNTKIYTNHRQNNFKEISDIVGIYKIKINKDLKKEIE